MADVALRTAAASVANANVFRIRSIRLMGRTREIAMNFLFERIFYEESPLTEKLSGQSRRRLAQAVYLAFGLVFELVQLVDGEGIFSRGHPDLA